MSTALAHDRQRLADATRQVQQLKGDAAGTLHDLGIVLNEVDEHELWRAGGHPNFTAWLEDEAQVTRGSAHRAMTVARHFNRELAVRYGPDKLYQGLRYMELTRAIERPGDLIAADLRLRGDDGRFGSVPFHTATVKQIERAVAEIAARRVSRVGPRSDDLRARLDKLSAALPAPPTGMTAARQRVETARTRGGKVALTFRQIPLDELRAFLDAVERELLDSSDEESDDES